MLHDKTTNSLSVELRSIYADCVPDFFKSIPLQETTSVSEQLKADLPYWHPANPVMLDLPTGTGKTSFVYDVLLPEALARGGNLLLVSNRIALSSQQKHIILNRLNDPRKRLLTEEGVRQQEDFGAVRVITYHRLPALIKDPSAKKWLSDLCFVIFDEAHFFVADAVFNEATDYYLELACSRFCHAVRIYLTGTSWDVLVPLAKAESKYYRCKTPIQTHPLLREGYRYTLPQNFDAYNLRFFTALEDLPEHIVQNAREKWLVFTDSKEKGTRFRSVCQSLGVSCGYVDADRKDSAEWQKIVVSEQFDSQVLVTTSVLDNGINIKDDAVKHIAIVTDNRVSLLQMLGRKRLKKGERVNVWVCNMSSKAIAARYGQCTEWLQWFDLVEQCPMQKHRYIEKALWRNEDPTLHKLFRLGDKGLFPNELAKFVIARRRQFYGRLLRGETTFKKEVESWFGIPSNDTGSAQLARFYCQYGDSPLCETLQNELRAIVLQCFEESGYDGQRSDRVNTEGATALNNRLSKMGAPYFIKKKNGEWLLSKIEDKERGDTIG